jgi:hypothetical protein
MAHELALLLSSRGCSTRTGQANLSSSVVYRLSKGALANWWTARNVSASASAQYRFTKILLNDCQYSNLRRDVDQSILFSQIFLRALDTLYALLRIS